MLRIRFIFSATDAEVIYYRVETVPCTTVREAWDLAERQRHAFRGEEFLLFLIESNIGGRPIHTVHYLGAPTADWIDVSPYIRAEAILENVDPLAAE